MTGVDVAEDSELRFARRFSVWTIVAVSVMLRWIWFMFVLDETLRVVAGQEICTDLHAGRLIKC